MNGRGCRVRRRRGQGDGASRSVNMNGSGSRLYRGGPGRNGDSAPLSLRLEFAYSPHQFLDRGGGCDPAGADKRQLYLRAHAERVPQFLLQLGELVADPEHSRRVDRGGLPLQSRYLRICRLQRRNAGPRGLYDDKVAEVRHEFGGHPAHVFPRRVERFDAFENGLDVSGDYGVRQTFEGGAADESEYAKGVVFGDFPAGEGDQLVQRRKGVAHSAFGAAGDGEKRVVVGIDAFLFADVFKARYYIVRLDAPQVEALAAGDDRRQDLFALRRGEYEPRVRRRLLERLEKRVPRRRTQHVAFVDDEDLVLRRRRLELHVFDYGFYVVDLVVRRGVDFGDVHRTAARYFKTVGAFAARFAPLRRKAVQRFGENPRKSGFAYSARADEQVGVRHAVRLDRVAKRPDYVLLSDHVGKPHRPVLQRKWYVLLFVHCAILYQKFAEKWSYCAGSSATAGGRPGSPRRFLNRRDFITSSQTRLAESRTLSR